MYPGPTESQKTEGGLLPMSVCDSVRCPATYMNDIHKIPRFPNGHSALSYPRRRSLVRSLTVTDSNPSLLHFRTNQIPKSVTERNPLWLSNTPPSRKFLHIHLIKLRRRKQHPCRNRMPPTIPITPPLALLILTSPPLLLPSAIPLVQW